MTETIDPHALWKTTLGELQLQVTPDIFEMYLQPTRAIEIVDGCIIIAVPNQFVHDWLTLRLNRAVLKTMRHIAGADLATKYIILARSGQQPLLEDPAEVMIRPGELRDPGYVRNWHDLRNLYGPMIGLAGIGLWDVLRGHVNDINGHPLQGKAWPGLRSIIAHYRDGRISIETALSLLNAAGLVEWQTGADLIALYQRHAAAGMSDGQNPGVSPQRLQSVLKNPHASRIYTVHDPLELPAFCVRFELAIALVDSRPRFEEYAGVINGRWVPWLTRIMLANMLTKITAEDFRRMGLA